MMSESESFFPPGSRCVLHGLRTRADLNGAHGTVIKHDKGRYAIALDRGDRFKVRSENLKHAADAQGDGQTVPTLFVGDNSRFYPLYMSTPSAHPQGDWVEGMADGSLRYRVALPAGHWEVVVVEFEPDNGRITVRLRATKELDDGSDEDALSELKCLWCTRVLLANLKGAELSHATLSVDGSVLGVDVPICKTALTWPANAEDALPTTQGWVVEWESISVHEDDRDHDEETFAGSSDGRGGMSVHEWEATYGVNGERRKSCCKRCGAGRCSSSVKRSRRLAQAGRRATRDCAVQRQLAHRSERTEPSWKTERSRTHRVDQENALN